MNYNIYIYIYKNKLQNVAKLPQWFLSHRHSLLISALWRLMNLSCAFSDYELRMNESEFGREKRVMPERKKETVAWESAIWRAQQIYKT